MPTTIMGEEDIALPEVDGSPCSSSDGDVDGLSRVNAQIDDVKATPQKKKEGQGQGGETPILGNS